MAVKIRLARGGAKKVPYYRIVVANATAPRDGDFLEKVGTYNPLLAESKVVLVKERISYWLSKGAQPTDRVAKFLEAEGVDLPAHIKQRMAIKLKSRTTKLSRKAAKEAASAPAPAKAPIASAPVEAAAIEQEVVFAPEKAAVEVVAEAGAVQEESAPAAEVYAQETAAPEAETTEEAAAPDAPAADEESKE